MKPRLQQLLAERRGEKTTERVVEFTEELVTDTGVSIFTLIPWLAGLKEDEYSEFF